MEELNERIALGYRLQKKHGVKSTNELIEIHRQLQDKLQEVLNIDESIQRKKDQSKLVHANLLTLAGKISETRKKQARPLEKKVNLLLEKVGMPNAKLKVEVLPSTESENGIDTVRFLFNANATDTDKNGYQPLKKVASGGELSRLMLCIKSLVAESIDLPVMVFDEIDSGISGEAARQVGLIMKDLAAKRQLICITHQPQIAGKASRHFYVYKEMSRDSIRTYIRELTEDERITIIAKMIGGEKPTAAAMENAREMVFHP